MTNETMIERGWSRSEDGKGWESPVRSTRPRAGKHDSKVWQYGPDEWGVSCGCGFTLVGVDEETARDAEARHFRADYDRPFASEILYTSKGHEIETRMSDEDAAKVLVERSAHHIAEGRPNKFVSDLASGFAKYESWTVGQRPWAHLLANEWLDRDATPAEPEEKVEAVSFPRIAAMMKAAAAELKYPKVRLADEDGNVLRLSLAGSRARFPGSVNVTDDASFENNTWYGRIVDGEWRPAGNAPEWVAIALAEFEKDPEAAAKAYGQRYAHCCFCARELVESGSVDVGYGPVCAKRWGLPHPQN